MGISARASIPWAAGAVLCALACALPATDENTAGEVEARGALEPADPLLEGGEHFDEYPVAAAVGDRITVDLVSTAFDTYLVLESPSGAWHENDDHEESTERSRLEVVADESGDWRVLATSYLPGEVGTYEIRIATAPDAQPGRLYRRGELAGGDEELQGGELADRVRFTGERGAYAWIDLRSRDFDPYLILLAPNGEPYENDDFRGSLSRSVVGMPLPMDGEYEVLVTSAAPGETGAWDLSVQQTAGSGPFQRVEAGELADGDTTLRTGELVDEYRFDGVAGQGVRATVSSDAFDTYLVLVGPDGDHLENDDDENGDSTVETELQSPGAYRVLVTSYEPGERGPYTLRIEVGEAEPLSEPEGIEIGSSRRGRLEPGDERLEDGGFVDYYTFQADAGTPVAAVMASGDLDTYLALVFPDGTVLENDDDWEQTRRSRIELTLPATGTYELAATSYGPGEVGEYLLDLRPPVGAEPPVRGAARRTLALLVGISDYGDRLSPLDHTADDARHLERVLLDRTDLRREDAILLVDGEATVERFRRSLLELASRMSAADQLVVFYSGHGGRLPREAFQPADPDGVDETLSLYDGELVDDQLAALLEEVPGRVLLVLDSCFAGGFSKDVISKPGRMGVFSSEEDVTSMVADKFRAGGYLAAFLVDALEGGRADDGDGHLTALELSHYLHERYRSDVKGGGPDDYVRTSGPMLGYQRLVVDRGSLSPIEVLFRLR